MPRANNEKENNEKENTRFNQTKSAAWTHCISWNPLSGHLGYLISSQTSYYIFVKELLEPDYPSEDPMASLDDGDVPVEGDMEP